MRKERFEELLSDKLHDLSVAPPDGLFDRISASLEEIPVAAPKQVVRRRIPSWRYASAAAALLLVVGISWMVIDHNAEESKALLATTSPSQAQHHSEPIAPPTKQSAHEATIATTTATEQDKITDRLRALFVEEAIAQEEQLAQLENPFKSTPLQQLLAAQPTEADQADNSKTTEIEGPQLADAPRAKRKANQGDPDEMWRRMAVEQHAAEQRGGGLVASLYGGNSGSMGTGTLRQRGIASLLNNNMMVTESTDGVFSAISLRAPQEAKLKHSMPLSFGVGVSLPLNDRLAIESGVVYNYLHSSSSAEQAMSTYGKVRNLHYLGIPMGISYNIIDRNAFDLYAKAGATIERGVSGNDLVMMDGEEMSRTEIDFTGIQPSVDLSLGAMFTSGNIGVYVEPGLAYYIPTASQPASYRTENPVSFSMKVGLKFLFGREK